jgi:hypothetical protein
VKGKRFIILFGVLLAALGLGIWLYLSPPPPQPFNARRIFAAAQAFSRDCIAKLRSVPPSVSLRELIASGYLSAQDAQAFEGMDVTVSLLADTNAASVLLRAKLTDGTEMVVLTDGTVRNGK